MSRDSITTVISLTVSITVQKLVRGLVLIIKTKSFKAFFLIDLGDFHSLKHHKSVKLSVLELNLSLASLLVPFIVIRPSHTPDLAEFFINSSTASLKISGSLFHRWLDLL